MKDKILPNWLFYALIALIGVIFMIYTALWGSPQKLSENIEKSSKLDSLFLQQTYIISIANESYEDYNIETVYIAFLDSASILKQKVLTLDVDLKKENSIDLEKYHDKQWKGQCLYIGVEYWRKDEKGCEIKKCILKTSSELKVKEGKSQLIITI
jgi:hypothetical protein